MTRLPPEIWVIIIEYVCCPLDDVERKAILKNRSTYICPIMSKKRRNAAKCYLANAANILKYSTVSKLFRYIALQEVGKHLCQCDIRINIGGNGKALRGLIPCSDDHLLSLDIFRPTAPTGPLFKVFKEIEFVLGAGVLQKFIDKFFPLCRSCKMRVWNEEKRKMCYACKTYAHFSVESDCFTISTGIPWHENVCKACIREADDNKFKHL